MKFLPLVFDVEWIQKIVKKRNSSATCWAIYAKI